MTTIEELVEKDPLQPKYVDGVNFEATCLKCRRERRIFQPKTSLFGKVYRCAVCGAKYGETIPPDAGYLGKPNNPELPKPRDPQTAFMAMFSPTSKSTTGGIPFAAILLPQEWTSLKALFDPAKGVDSWRGLVPKDSFGVPTMEEADYIKRARHVLASIAKDREDARATQLARETEKRLEARYAQTHFTLTCGCQLEKGLVFQRYADNLAHAQRMGWIPILKKGGFTNCSRPDHSTLTDKDGNVMGTDYRDYTAVARLTKETK